MREGSKRGGVMISSGKVIQACEAEEVFRSTHQRLELLRSVLSAYSRAAEHDEVDGCISWEAFQQLELIVENTSKDIDRFAQSLVEALQSHGPLLG